MRRKIEIFLFGAVGYTSIEVVCRGRSHWSMALAGGVCLLTLFLVSRQMQGRSLLVQAAAGAAVVTGIELIVGIVVNLWLGWKVWDYTNQPLNLLGQICPQYSLYWFLLTLPAMYYFRQEESG
ncbi:MAG TPA: putative ABC transporter permease [Candidatus Pygmaiobacter gallistercoris]|nr:putative ABC transporter permease [Candidatus Pygmaiobacter gallistercoris]